MASFHLEVPAMKQVYTEEAASLSIAAPRRPIRARGVDRRLRALKPEILALVESIIESGVNPGETVVTDGQLRLTPKSHVEVKNAL